MINKLMKILRICFQRNSNWNYNDVPVHTFWTTENDRLTMSGISDDVESHCLLHSWWECEMAEPRKTVSPFLTKLTYTCHTTQQSCCEVVNEGKWIRMSTPRLAHNVLKSFFFFFFNTPLLEITQMSINGWVEKL